MVNTKCVCRMCRFYKNVDSINSLSQALDLRDESKKLNKFMQYNEKRAVADIKINNYINK